MDTSLAQILQSLESGLPLLLLHFGATLALFFAAVAVYVAVTPMHERELLAQGNMAAGVLLGGTVVALAIPLAATLATSLALIDIVIWGAVALAIQLVTFLIAIWLFRDLRSMIEAGAKSPDAKARTPKPRRRGSNTEAQTRQGGPSIRRPAGTHRGIATMISFIRNLLGVKTDQAVQSAVEALVRWDPKAATEAELRTMEEHLDQLGLQVAQARSAYEKEQKEADAITALSRQRMAAAEHIQRQLEGEADAGRKAQLEKSLDTLVTMLEQMAPDIEREEKDAVDAREFLDTLEKTYSEAGNKLKQARADLQRAEREMGRAAQQRDMAQQRADAARQAAGLSGATSSLGTALKAMQDAASRDLASAEAANSKARLLKPSKPEEEDPNIKAALAAATGATPLPSSLSDRLAALKTKG